MPACLHGLHRDHAFLPRMCREDTLRLYFEQFGALENAEVMKDRYTGKSRWVMSRCGYIV